MSKLPPTIVNNVRDILDAPLGHIVLETSTGYLYCRNKGYWTPGDAIGLRAELLGISNQEARDSWGKYLASCSPV